MSQLVINIIFRLQLQESVQKQNTNKFNIDSLKLDEVKD